MRTATAYASPTLNAPVEILDQPRLAGSTFTEVRTLPGGVGGWSVVGKVLVVRTSILRDITDTDSVDSTVNGSLAEPAPLSAPITGDEYMRVLLARQAHYIASHRTPAWAPPLLEWFVKDEDVRWVILPETRPQPKKPTTPRKYRSAASIRTELADVEAKMTKAAGVDEVPDRAVANLSPHARSKAAARAGRRRFEQMDRDLARYAQLVARRDRLAGQLKRAEERERD